MHTQLFSPWNGKWMQSAEYVCIRKHKLLMIENLGGLRYTPIIYLVFKESREECEDGDQLDCVIDVVRPYVLTVLVTTLVAAFANDFVLPLLGKIQSRIAQLGRSFGGTPARGESDFFLAPFPPTFKIDRHLELILSGEPNPKRAAALWMS